MELLYLIDRTTTHALQSFSRWLEGKIGFSIGKQRMIFAIQGYMIGFIITSLINKPYHELFFSEGFFIEFFITFASIQLSVPLGAILYRLHAFFDPDGAKKEDKLYSDGYLAWADIIFGAILIWIAVVFLPDTFALPVIAGGFTIWGYMAYYDFIRRHKGTGRKRKKGMTEALRALLERCRDFIPVPQPLPEGE